MFMNFHQVKKAVERVGGPTKTSNLLNVSNGAVHSWIKANRVFNIDHARKLAEVAGMKVEDLRPVP